MQDCDKEVAYMREEQNKILKQDWSDQMVDHADTRRQYEVSWSHDLYNGVDWGTDISIEQRFSNCGTWGPSDSDE